MASFKKIELMLPAELLKAAKQKAGEADQSVSDWILDLIFQKIQDPEQSVMHSLDWGRIDSRIDQRTAFLEQKIESLSAELYALLQQISSEKRAEVVHHKPERATTTDFVVSTPAHPQVA